MNDTSSSSPATTITTLNNYESCLIVAGIMIAGALFIGGTIIFLCRVEKKREIRTGSNGRRRTRAPLGVN